MNSDEAVVRAPVWPNPDAVVFWTTAGLSAALWLLVPLAA